MEIRFVQVVGQPHLMQPCCMSQSAVHALMVTDALTREHAFQLLLDQACRFGQLPTHMPCIHGLLRTAGYMKHTAYYDDLDHAARLLADADADRAIVRIGYHYYPIFRAEDGSCYELRAASRPCIMCYTELWMPIPAGKALPASRPLKPTPLPTFSEHETFRFFQPNPLRRHTGDCVLRGMAGVLQLSWADAMRAIAQASGYRNAQLNSTSVFEQLLEQKGFVKHEKELSGRKRMTGGEFCQWAEQHYTHGERILAHIGGNHVAAVLPEQQPDGSYRYAIHDSWDSTVRRVTAYWVRPFQPAKAMKRCRFTVGQDIVHPGFGIGHIVDMERAGDNLRLIVTFAQGETRLLCAAWVDAHCILTDAMPRPA